MNIKLSALDQGPIAVGGNASEALHNTIKLAKELDNLGYTRFWVSEHHNTESLASSSPEILISAIAAQTKNIRVGSGGVMLPHYSPYKIAENFKVLEGLYPNRIDLGIGRAPGGMPLATRALQKGKNLYVDDYEEKVLELVGYLYDSLPKSHEFSNLKATPLVNTVPQLHILGSSGGSSSLAASLGAYYGYANFISAGMAASSMNWYRENFRETVLSDKPNTIYCTFAICAETEEEANNLARVMDLALLLIVSGELKGVPTVEQAMNYNYTEKDLEIINRNRGRIVVGTPEQIKEQFLNIKEKYGVDEFMILTLNTDMDVKIKSYKLIAEAFNIKK